MKTNLLALRDEAYGLLGVADLPPVGDVMYERGMRIIKNATERVLEAHGWFFARKRVTLSGSGGRFELPADFMSLLHCSSDVFELRGDEIIINGGDTVSILYVSRAVIDGMAGNATVSMPRYFAELVATKAAEELSPLVLGGDMNAGVNWYKLFTLKLTDAITDDVRQYASHRKIEPLDLYNGDDGPFYPLV